MPRSVLPVVLAAVMLTMLTGCSAGPFPTVQSAVDSFNQTLRSMPGVHASNLDEPPVAGVVRVDLVVTLDDEVTQGELDDIGEYASTFPTVQLDAGQYSGTVELRLAGSAYSYFDLPTSDALSAQLAYWRELASLGFESVSTRTYSAPVTAGTVEANPQRADEATLEGATAGSTPSLDSPVPSSASSFGAAARGRLVVVELSSDAEGDERRTAELLEAARAVSDPGAATGEWDLMGLAPFTTGQFVQSSVPSASQVDFVRSASAMFDESEQLASVHVRVDEAGGGTQVNVTAFDDSMEGVRSADASKRFRETVEWGELQRLLTRLQQTGHDFSVNFVGNNLTGLGVFELKFGVKDCDFWAGQQWPDLAQELELAWAAGLQVPGDPRAAAEVCAALR